MEAALSFSPMRTCIYRTVEKIEEVLEISHAFGGLIDAILDSLMRKFV